MENEALSRLYAKHQREIYLYIFSLCKDSEVAQDILQETFLKAILSLSDGHENVRAWLYMVARNLYFNYAKRAGRSQPLDDGREIVMEQELADRLIANENMQLLYKALGRLETKKREILLMQYFGKLSVKEIGAILHITAENVRVSSYRAKKDLKKFMEEDGYEIS